MNPVTSTLRREIQEYGAIPFARFMEVALYMPEAGYYEQAEVVGRTGDFATNASIGSLFGELLAHQFAEWLAFAAGPGGLVQILEAGAHTGQLACDLLTAMRSHYPEHLARLEYWILEPSQRRRDWQMAKLAGFSPRARWFATWEELPAEGVRGVIFSNELLDAMPFHRMVWDPSSRIWLEWGVGLEGDQFVWRPLPESEGWDELRRLAVKSTPGDLLWPTLPAELLECLPDGFSIEISPAAFRWWADAAAALNRGKLMTIDYGWTAEQFFRPERSQGTFRSYHQHRTSNDVLSEPGARDITAHVNFTALQRVGEAAGLETTSLEPQSTFLTRIVQQLWRDGAPPDGWTPERTRQFQTLSHPEHFGRSFNVLVQSRS
jgi:SAM-dependent MidA family methyltransferase